MIEKKYLSYCKKTYLCGPFLGTKIYKQFKMNQYETVFIVTPVLSQDQLNEVTSKYKELLQENGAEIVNEESWGLKKLAYPINKKSTGFYHLFEFKASGDLIAKLEITFKRDERIMRNLTVSLDKYAIEYNAKRRQKLADKTAAK